MRVLILFLLCISTCRGAKFEKYFPHLIKAEGILFTVVQYDKGGATKFGVTLDTYKMYCVRTVDVCDKNRDGKLSAIDLSMTTIVDVKPIYKSLYWELMKADEINNQAIAEIIVDMMVNSGAGKDRKHIKAFQKMVGVSQTGYFGNATIKAINKNNSKVLYGKIFKYRTHFYKAIGVGKQTKFLRGWLNRINNLQKMHENERYI